MYRTQLIIFPHPPSTKPAAPSRSILEIIRIVGAAPMVKEMALVAHRQTWMLRILPLDTSYLLVSRKAPAELAQLVRPYYKLFHEPRLISDFGLGRALPMFPQLCDHHLSLRKRPL